jgi:hypothetical protein
MASILDFSKFTFSAEQIRSVKELVYDEVIAAPEIDLLQTFFEGIVYDKEVGFIGEGGLVGVAAQGCDPQPQAWNIATRVVKWEPKGWEILIEQCAKDIEATAAVYSLRTGIDYLDFTDTDYMAIVVEVLVNSVKEFVVRLFWFSDTAAKNVTDGGEITDGIDVKYFNIIDGFYKQMITQITANPAQRVAVAENAGASYAAQALTPAKAYEYLNALTFVNNPVLTGNMEAKLFVTQSFANGYTQYLQGLGLQATYENLVNGVKALIVNGRQVIAVPTFDKIIQAYYNTGAKWINPHRAVFATKTNLAAGVDSVNSFGDMSIWYNRDSRKVKVEMMGKADAKIANPSNFAIAI